MKIALTVNGRHVEADVAPRTSLADFVREHLLLTGTHVGCEHGICGACTVEIDGEIARACITYAVTCDGAHVRTIEGFDHDPVMGAMRQAFTQEHALQCGYCTPGILIAARDLVRRKRDLSRAEIRTEMSGNLCRCTGYVGIVNAIARVMAEQPAPEQAAGPRARKWLGPAPGPQAERHADAYAAHTDGNAAPAPTGHAGPALPRTQTPPVRHGEPVQVTLGEVQESVSGMRLSQWFVLRHPRAAVWELMSNPETIAACMPGARLDGPPQAGKIAGRIEVKLGPIAASFAGEGTLEEFPAEFRQVISGRGGDRRSGSRVSGSVDYHLTALADPNAGESTRVDVAIAYQLTGLLAQFGRSGLARDLALRMGEAFAQNLDAHLDAALRGDAAAPQSQAPIGALALAWQLISARLRALLRKFSGR
jgi:carbon-monoxide dehydrogenase small subunit